MLLPFIAVGTSVWRTALGAEGLREDRQLIAITVDEIIKVVRVQVQELSSGAEVE